MQRKQISQHYSPLLSALLLAGNYATQIVLNKNTFKLIPLEM